MTRIGLVKAIFAGGLLIVAGYGWIAVESRHPIVFRLLDRYEEDVRLRERNESVRRGIEEIERRTGVKQKPNPLASGIAD